MQKGLSLSNSFYCHYASLQFYISSALKYFESIIILLIFFFLGEFRSLYIIYQNYWKMQFLWTRTRNWAYNWISWWVTACIAQENYFLFVLNSGIESQSSHLEWICLPLRWVLEFRWTDNVLFVSSIPFVMEMTCHFTWPYSALPWPMCWESSFWKRK